MNRRNALSMLATGAGASILNNSIGQNDAIAQRYQAANPHSEKLKITKVKAIHTYPNGTGFGIVKVETNEQVCMGSAALQVSGVTRRSRLLSTSIWLRC